jgi:hypothetical protein
VGASLVAPEGKLVYLDRADGRADRIARGQGRPRHAITGNRPPQPQFQYGNSTFTISPNGRTVAPVGEQE